MIARKIEAILQECVNFLGFILGVCKKWGLKMQTQQAIPSDDRRKYERYPCPHGAQTFHESAWRDCAVEDISAGGALIANMERPAVGSVVMLFVEDVAELPGVVVRHTEDGFALRFELSTTAKH